jgi:hypothetical protein
MKPEQELVANVVAVLLLATLAGLAARGRILLCRSFAAYLTLALTTNRLITWWPERFYTSGFWTLKETLYALLMPLLALELTAVALEAFPRARRAGLAVLVTIAGLTVLAVAAAPGPDYSARMGLLLARAQTGAVWGFVALLTIASWYHLPLHPTHRSIILGFALYLGFYGALLSAVGHFGWSAYRYLAALDPAAYAATVGLWMLAAWRKEEASALGPEARRHLQPWVHP